MEQPKWIRESARVSGPPGSAGVSSLTYKEGRVWYCNSVFSYLSVIAP